MDKVQKIRKEVARMHNLLPVMDGDNISVNYADRICTTLEMYIDSMQEEPTTSVWHDISEKPKMNSIIVMNNSQTTLSVEYVGQSLCGVERWAYLDILLKL